MMEETSGGGVWVLIGVELGFSLFFFSFFFPVVIGVDRRLGS